MAGLVRTENPPCGSTPETKTNHSLSFEISLDNADVLNNDQSKPVFLQTVPEMSLCSRLSKAMDKAE